MVYSIIAFLPPEGLSMKQDQAIKKWSDLRGMAIVSLANGKKIGTCDDFYFDPEKHDILALRVKTGLLGHKILPAADINGIGQDAITIADEGVLHRKLEGKTAASALSGQDLQRYRVMSESGTLVGTIGNILIEIKAPTELQVCALELAGGLRELIGSRYPTFPAGQVTNYGQDVLIIPDEVARSLH